ncbi:hypothetical protein pb186bvf_009436 [Paramecium bursaria]
MQNYIHIIFTIELYVRKIDLIDQSNQESKKQFVNIYFIQQSSQ